VKLFFDTSALVKLFHEEDGTRAVEQLVVKESTRVRVLELAKLEFSSALYRRYRGGELDDANLEIAMSGFLQQMSLFEVIGLDGAVVSRARELISEHGKVEGLRSLDALHLGAFASGADEGWIFVCADRRLAGIARRAGFEVIDPMEGSHVVGP